MVNGVRGCGGPIRSLAPPCGNGIALRGGEIARPDRLITDGLSAAVAIVRAIFVRCGSSGDPARGGAEAALAVIHNHGAARGCSFRNPVVDQGSHRAVVHVAIHVPGNAGNRTGIGVLPEVPCAPPVTIRTGTPWCSGGRVLPVVIRNEGAPLRYPGVKVAGHAGAGIDDWFDRDSFRGGFGDDGVAPLVGPLGVAAGAHMPCPNLHVQHRHQSQAIGLDVRAGQVPEVVGLGLRAIVTREGVVIGAHVNTGGLAVVHVGDKIAVGRGESASGLSPGKPDS